MSTEEQAVTMEEMSERALSGEITQDEFDAYLEGLEEDNSDTEDSRPSEKDTEPETAEQESEDQKDDPAEQDSGKEEESEEEPVVLAKDGKNTIPFSVLEDTREELQATKGELDELKQIVEDLKSAQQEDEESGNTEATDTLLEELEEDYPGITGKLKSLVLADIKPVIDELKTEEDKRREMTAEEQAQVAFAQSVDELLQQSGTETTYSDIVANQKFWEWFDTQPSYIRAAEKSGDPQQIADVIGLYSQTATEGETSGEDKKAAAQQKVEEAREKAKGKNKVNSISDIPGGSPYSTEAEAIANMSDEVFSDKLQDMEPDEINKFLDRHL